MYLRAPAATSLIAQLVPGANQRPDAWPKEPADGECEQVQICRIVEADTGRESYPEGLFYQLIVRLHRYSLGRQDYDKSVPLAKGHGASDGYNGCALLRSAANEIRITVRAAYPGFFLHILTGEVAPPGGELLAGPEMPDHGGPAVTPAKAFWKSMPSRRVSARTARNFPARNAVNGATSMNCS